MFSLAKKIFLIQYFHINLVILYIFEKVLNRQIFWYQNVHGLYRKYRQNNFANTVGIKCLSNHTPHHSKNSHFSYCPTLFCIIIFDNKLLSMKNCIFLCHEKRNVKFLKGIFLYKDMLKSSYI